MRTIREQLRIAISDRWLDLLILACYLGALLYVASLLFNTVSTVSATCQETNAVLKDAAIRWKIVQKYLPAAAFIVVDGRRYELRKSVSFPPLDCK